MILTMLAAGVAASVMPAAKAEPRVRDVVLVHGAVMDGSSWRGVYEELHRDGYRVIVAQLQLTGLAADIAAAREAIGRAKDLSCSLDIPIVAR